MKIRDGQWMEIFRAGSYGSKGSYTGSDLDDIVSNFKRSGAAPIVLGHPNSDSPAHGWLLEVKRTGDKLIEKVGRLHSDFVDAVEMGKFRNRSVRIEPTETGPKLLHLGFLGAVLPHVEGLASSVMQFTEEGAFVDELPSGNEDFASQQDSCYLLDLSHCV